MSLVICKSYYIYFIYLDIPRSLALYYTIIQLLYYYRCDNYKNEKKNSSLSNYLFYLSRHPTLARPLGSFTNAKMFLYHRYNFKYNQISSL